MASDRPTIGLALIARDEEDALPALLATCDGAFDEVVLLDTGSRDRSVECFFEWSKGQPGTLCHVERFKWRDDFAAARQRADDLLGTDWVVWADCDDEIVGAPRLQGLAAGAPPEVAAYFFGYDVARDDYGNCTCYSRRERMVRAGRGRWVGRVHEVKVIDGQTAHAGADIAEWVHHRERKASRPVPRAPRPDIAVLSAELERKPDDPRTTFYLAQSHADIGARYRAIELYERRAQMGGWEEEVFLSHLRSGILRADQGDWTGGLQALLRAWECRPERVEPLYELATRLRLRGEHDSAHLFARRGLDRPRPQEALFVQPWIYEWGLLFEYSISAYLVGDFTAAEQACERLLAMPKLPDPHRRQTEQNLAATRARTGGDAVPAGPAMWSREVPDLLDRWARTPGSAEPLLLLAAGYRAQGKMAPARMFAERGLAVVSARRRSGRAGEVAWGLELELAIACYWLGDTQSALDACERVLAFEEAPPEVHGYAAVQRDLCRRRQRQEQEQMAGVAPVPNYVVMPVRGREDLTTEILRELVDQGGAERIFVYDNDGSLAIDSGAGVVETIPAVGKSIHQMWNAGVAECLARSPVCNIAILNNDLELGPEFLRSLARALRSEDSLVAVSPNYDGRVVIGTVQRTHGIADGRQDGSGGLAGYAFMVKGELFAAGLPRFDEQFELWYGDNDFVDSAEQFGGWCGITGLTSVVHIGGGSQTTLGREGIPANLRAAIERDRQRYLKKWSGPRALEALPAP